MPVKKSAKDEAKEKVVSLDAWREARLTPNDSQ